MIKYSDYVNNDPIKSPILTNFLYFQNGNFGPNKPQGGVWAQGNRQSSGGPFGQGNNQGNQGNRQSGGPFGQGSNQGNQGNNQGNRQGGGPGPVRNQRGRGGPHQGGFNEGGPGGPKSGGMREVANVYIFKIADCDRILIFVTLEDL